MVVFVKVDHSMMSSKLEVLLKVKRWKVSFEWGETLSY